MIQLVMSLVMSCSDYYNSVLFGLPASTLSPLRWIQNSAAGLVLVFSQQSHITPALQQVHWLPVKFWIMFKIATIMHNIFHQCFPPYFKDLVTFHINDSQHSQLWSSSTGSAVVYQTRIQFGRHAFSVCRPDVWKSPCYYKAHQQSCCIPTST